MISIVIPTIPAREESLQRTLETYESNTEYGFEFIVVRGEETCGAAWRAGAEKAKGNYIHLTADDITPWKGWDDAALFAMRGSIIPAPLIWLPEDENGKTNIQAAGGDMDSPDHILTTVQSNWTKVDYTGIPFLKREWWPLIEMPDIHFYSDAWISYAARLHGIETKLAHQYSFTHWMDPAGREVTGLTPHERDACDYLIFRQEIVRKRKELHGK